MTRLGEAISEDLIAPGLREADERWKARFETVAINLLAMAHDVEFVSKATGLSEAEVTALAAYDVPLDLR